MSKEIHIVTYPRCGSVYLFNLFSKSFQKKVYKKHLNSTSKITSPYMKDNDYYNDAVSEYFKTKNYVITTLRDPLDSISSICSMENFYDKDIDIDYNIKRHIEYYTNSLTNISKFADLTLNFNDINIYKDSILEFVSYKTNNKIINKNYIPEIVDAPKVNFLKSSKTSENYKYIKEKVNDSDLTKCYEIYNKLINDCKKFK